MPPKKPPTVKSKSSKSKVTEQITSAIANNTRGDFEKMRKFKRRTVVWPVVLYVNEFEMKCILYDISLGGIRLKLDIPLAIGTPVQIKIKNFSLIDAVVTGSRTPFLEFKFCRDPAHIKSLLGDYVQMLI